MKIKKNSVYPLIVIKTPKNCSFYQEHIDLINSKGYVWFAKLGNGSLKISSVSSCEDIVFIKDSGNLYSGLYVADVLEVSNTTPTDLYFPSYYLDIKKEKSIWFKISNLHPVPVDVLDTSFVGNSSGGSVLNILRSICPAFFIKCTHSQEI